MLLPIVVQNVSATRIAQTTWHAYDRSARILVLALVELTRSVGLSVILQCAFVPWGTPAILSRSAYLSNKIRPKIKRHLVYRTHVEPMLNAENKTELEHAHVLRITSETRTKDVVPNVYSTRTAHQIGLALETNAKTLVQAHVARTLIVRL